MQLSPHFNLSEFTRSDTAQARGISNEPGPAHLANLRKLADRLEEVRALLGQPMAISSGYRSPALNRAVDGSTTSSHSIALAADFTCPKFGTVMQTCVAIRDSALPFDQLIYEQTPGGEWVHFGMGPKMRREVLSWSKRTGCVPGIVELG